MRLPQGLPRLALVAAASAAAYAASWYFAENLGPAYSLSLQQLVNDLIWLILGPLIVSGAAVIVTLASRSLIEGLVVSLTPLAVNWEGPLSLVEEGLSALTALVLVIAAALALRLLFRVPPYTLPTLTAREFSPVPLSLASAAIAVEATVSAPWLPVALWPQLAYALASAISAMLASTRARSMPGAVGGVLSSLGPLGLVIVLELGRLSP